MNIGRKNRRFFQAAALFASVVFLVGTAGCGGAGSGLPITPPSTQPFAGAITRATEDTVSTDAKILTARKTVGAFLSLSEARAFDADLAKIRAAYPDAADIHAFPDVVPTEIIVSAAYSAPWLAKWQASAALADPAADSDLTTGEADLDALLKKYSAVRTAEPLDLGDGIYFRLQFAQSLNTRVVAPEFSQAKPHIVSAEPNRYFGDGDNLVYAPGQNGAKVYAFSQGYGDCPAGCIYRSTRTFTVAANGGITVETSGTPPGSSGQGF